MFHKHTEPLLKERRRMEIKTRASEPGCREYVRTNTLAYKKKDGMKLMAQYKQEMTYARTSSFGWRTSEETRGDKKGRAKRAPVGLRGALY